MEQDARGDVQSPAGVRPAAVRIPQRGRSDADQHEGPNLDSHPHPCRRQGHELRRLSESHTAHTSPAPADPHGRLVRDADTTHYRLLSGVFTLQEMACQTWWSVPLP